MIQYSIVFQRYMNEVVFELNQLLTGFRFLW